MLQTSSFWPVHLLGLNGFLPGVLGRCLSHGALEQTGKVGDIRDTYLLRGLRDRVMMIPEQVRRKSSAAPASQAQHHRGGRRPADDFPARSGPPASGC